MDEHSGDHHAWRMFWACFFIGLGLWMFLDCWADSYMHDRLKWSPSTD